MKQYFAALIMLLLLSVSDPAFTQNSSSAKPVYVIVHGAWGGGWAFRKVDSLMTEKGAIVYRPTLTGQGERVHLATPQVGLNTHINDVVNMILYEDLHNVILVGHSYGGMVVTGVGDSLPSRISKLIYLDAFLPANGESVFSIQGTSGEGFKKLAVGGFFKPGWVPAGKAPPKDVPHSLKTFIDTLVLHNDAAKKIPITYILTVAKGTDPKADDFAKHAERARQRGYPVLQLEADHNPQWSVPEALVEMFLKLGGDATEARK
jgi:pimeloyl-ACP methyl ester carboxylesterase